MLKTGLLLGIATIAGACNSPDTVAYYKSHLSELDQEIDRCALHHDDPDSARCQHATRAYYELHVGDGREQAAPANTANVND